MDATEELPEREETNSETVSVESIMPTFPIVIPPIEPEPAPESAAEAEQGPRRDRGDPTPGNRKPLRQGRR